MSDFGEEAAPRLVRVTLLVFTPAGRIFLGNALPGEGMSEADFELRARSANVALTRHFASEPPARDASSMAKLRARILDILPGLLSSQGLRFAPPGEV